MSWFDLGFMIVESSGRGGAYVALHDNAGRVGANGQQDYGVHDTITDRVSRWPNLCQNHAHSCGKAPLQTHGLRVAAISCSRRTMYSR